MGTSANELEDFGLGDLGDLGDGTGEGDLGDFKVT